jgi:hypothetical protein
MTYKNFYTDFKNQIFFEKKILSESIYGKHYIRNNLLTNVTQIDNSINFSNIVTTKFVSTGFSFYNKSFLFKHKFNKYLKINSFLNVSSSMDLPLCLRLYKSFQILQLNNRAKFNKQMFFLNPRKGGFTVYSIGIKGFLPRSHTFFFFKNFLKRRLIQNKHLVLALSTFFISNQHVTKKYLSFKIPFYKIKITLYPNYILKFSAKTIQKKWSLKNSLKVVFLGVHPKTFSFKQPKTNNKTKFRKQTVKKSKS